WRAMQSEGRLRKWLLSRGYLHKTRRKDLRSEQAGWGANPRPADCCLRTVAVVSHLLHCLDKGPPTPRLHNRGRCPASGFSVSIACSPSQRTAASEARSEPKQGPNCPVVRDRRRESRCRLRRDGSRDRVSAALRRVLCLPTFLAGQAGEPRRNQRPP